MSDAFGAGNGVVSAQDHRLAQAGLIAPQSSTLAVRDGILMAPGVTALVTGTSATGTMTVNVAAHHWVTTRAAGDGVYIGALEAATTVNIAAAPGSNSRIDVIWAKQQDTSASTSVSPDGSAGPLYGATAGTAGAVPVKPSIPVGAVELATVQVAAGATATNGAGVTITNTGRLTVARGARVPCRNQAEEDALTKYASLEIYRLDTGQIKVSNGSTFAVTYDPAVTVTTLARGRVGSATFDTAGLAGIGTTELMFDTVTFTAVAGRRYKVTWDAGWIAIGALITAAFTIRSAGGGSVTNTSTLRRSRLTRSPTVGEFIPIVLTAEVTGLSSGTATVGIGGRVALGGGNITIPGAVDNTRGVIVEDIGV